jgi:sarcosine oxidase, subunit beta
MSSPELPARAEVVVIGGGVMGVSIAFHLAEAGVTDVVLLEADALGSGSTCKAAGGVRAQFSDRVNIELGARSLRAFRSFATRPGGEIDLQQVGYLFLLTDAATLAAFEQNVALQNELGVPSRIIDPAQALALSPLISTDGLMAAAYSPEDGHCTPEAVVLGYATAARALGARLLTGVAVTGLEPAGAAAFDVLAAGQVIRTGCVVCTAGAWSQQIGAWAGVPLPVTPLRRQIVVTGPIAGLPDRLPMTIDFATSLYFHREGPGLLIGMSDPDETPGFRLSQSDAWLPRLSETMAQRAPALASYGIASGWAGLYEDSPDHNALIGQSQPAGRFLYATGFSGHGFLMAPAVGEVMRDLYLERTPPVDVGPLDAGRFAADSARYELNIV